MTVKIIRQFSLNQTGQRICTHAIIVNGKPTATVVEVET